MLIITAIQIRQDIESQGVGDGGDKKQDSLCHRCHAAEELDTTSAFLEEFQSNIEDETAILLGDASFMRDYREARRRGYPQRQDGKSESNPLCQPRKFG